MTVLDCMVADQLVSNEESPISTITLTVNILIRDISGPYVLPRSILFTRQITHISYHMIANRNMSISNGIQFVLHTFYFNKR